MRPSATPITPPPDQAPAGALLDVEMPTAAPESRKRQAGDMSAAEPGSAVPPAAPPAKAARSHVSHGAGSPLGYADFAVPMAHLRSLLLPMLGPLSPNPVRWGRLRGPEGTVDLAGPVCTVGRSAKCAVRVFSEDSELSPLVCRLSWVAGAAAVEATTSSAAVSVNGGAPLRKGAKARLHDGDRLRLRSQSGAEAAFAVELDALATAEAPEVLAHVRRAAEAVCAAAHAQAAATSPRAHNRSAAKEPHTDWADVDAPADVRAALEAAAHARLRAPVALAGRLPPPPPVALAGTPCARRRVVEALARGVGARLVVHERAQSPLAVGDRVRVRAAAGTVALLRRGSVGVALADGHQPVLVPAAEVQRADAQAALRAALDAAAAAAPCVLYVADEAVASVPAAPPGVLVVGSSPALGGPVLALPAPAPALAAADERRANAAELRRALATAGVAVVDDDLPTGPAGAGPALAPADAERVVGWAVGHALQHHAWTGDDALPAAALARALEMHAALQPPAEMDEHERFLRDEALVPKGELDVPFDSVGALGAAKRALFESVMLPLRRPDLFQSPLTAAPCRGVLLFGPPGTGKTMLAKAVATEAGANFLHVAMSTLASRWFGEAEKHVRAVFSLAAKLSPCVVFIDEVDSMLSQRGGGRSQKAAGEHDAMRKFKNEFLTHWDGLRSDRHRQVVLLAATNRPFDLDEAVLRRFPRRLLLDLPDADARRDMLRVMLGDEPLHADVSLDRVAALAPRFSGSDLRALCAAAAAARIREIVGSGIDDLRAAMAAPPAAPVDVGPLAMRHFEAARKEVCASTSEDGLAQLREWNGAFGGGGAPGGSREHLSYFT